MAGQVRISFDIALFNSTHKDPTVGFATGKVSRNASQGFLGATKDLRRAHRLQRVGNDMTPRNRGTELFTFPEGSDPQEAMDAFRQIIGVKEVSLVAE